MERVVTVSKENAEKFYALYQQHQAFAKRLAELNAKSEEELLEGLAKLAKEVGLPATKEEIGGMLHEAVEDPLGGVAGGSEDVCGPTLLWIARTSCCVGCQGE